MLKLSNNHIQKIGAGTTTTSIGDEISFVSFDNSTPTVASYDGTNIQAVFFPQPSNDPNVSLYFVTFEQNGSIGDMALFIGIQQLSETTYRASYYDLDNNLVAQFDADSVNISNINTFALVPPSNATFGWWGRWTACASNGLNNLTTYPVAGIACMIFVGPCAGGLVVFCAFNATF